MSEEKAQDWVFTFGSNHVTREGMSLGNCYLVIHSTFEGARDLICEARGGKWAFQYSNKDEAGVNRFRLREVSLDDVRI